MHEILEFIKAVIWPLAIIIAVIVFYRLARSGLIKSFSASKDQGVHVDMASRDERDAVKDETKYLMDRRIQAIDEAVHAKIKAKTRELRRPFARAVLSSGICAPAMQAVAMGMRDPIDQAVDDNNLRDNLSGSVRDSYLAAKLDGLAGEYQDLLADAAMSPCATASATSPIPPWAEIEPKLREALGAWGATVATIIAEGSREKIEVYKEYRPQFEAAGIAYNVRVCDECADKNRLYIQALVGDPRAVAA